MKEKPIKTCLNIDCLDKICSKCQKGDFIESFNKGGICSYCQEPFIGNPCTAGEKLNNEWKGDFETWFEFEYMGKVGEFWQLTDYIENLLKSERQKLISDIELLVADEINLARSDGFPTARLTSLFNKIKKLK